MVLKILKSGFHFFTVICKPFVVNALVLYKTHFSVRQVFAPMHLRVESNSFMEWPFFLAYLITSHSIHTVESIS
jgi:hypothetical protein